jgi:hypothetical protein
LALGEVLKFTRRISIVKTPGTTFFKTGKSRLMNGKQHGPSTGPLKLITHHLILFWVNFVRFPGVVSRSRPVSSNLSLITHHYFGLIYLDLP